MSPVGRSPAQSNARRLARDEGYRRQIIATRQIERTQRRTPLRVALEQSTPGPRGVRVQQKIEGDATARANTRAQHIAAQQVRMVQDQVPNPQRAAGVLAGQLYSKLRTANDIGRLTKVATDTSGSLGHRVGALRALRSRYGIPVTNQNFHAFREAQAFHEFLHSGKEGDTVTVPLPVQKTKGLHLTSQTYQLRKVGGKLQPIAVQEGTSLKPFDLLSGHPYKKGYTPTLTARQAIQQQTGGVARGFTHAGLDIVNYGTRAIPEGKIGTPLRRGLTEAATVPIQVPSSIYGTAAALVNAARGNPKDLKALASQFSEDDPIGRLITHGDLKAFGRHPGIAVAELFGGLGSLDRAAGRVSRGGGVIGLHGGRGTFGRGDAPGLRIGRSSPQTRLAVQERYSKGYVIAKRQRTADARSIERYNAKRSEAISEAMKAEHAKAAGDLQAQTLHQNRALDLAHEAERLNPHKLTADRNLRHIGHTTDFGRLGDVQEGVSQARQRAGRTEVLQTLLGKGAVRSKNRTPGVLRKGSEAVVQALLAQGALAPNRADLLAYAKHLADAEPHIVHDAEKVALNRRERQAVLEVAAAAGQDPHLLSGLMTDARQYARVNRTVHEEAHAADILPREEARMSALKVFAVRRLGAVADSEGILRRPRDGASAQDVAAAAEAADKAAATERALRGRGSDVDRNRLAHAEGEAQIARAHLDELAPRLQAGQIEQAMRNFAKTPEGAGHILPDEVAFVSHSPSITRPGVFNVRGDSAKGLPTRRRTGEAIRHGTSNPGRDAMVGTVVRLRNMVSAVRSFRDLVENGAVRYRGGEKHGQVIAEATRADAERVYREQFTDEHGHLMPGFVPGRAVRLNPFGGREEQLARTLEEGNSESVLDAEGFSTGGAGIAQDIEHALKGGSGEGPWTVIPEPFARRLAEHATVTAGSSPLVRSITSAFRHTVLPFSPTWLAGNVIEAELRSALAGAGKKSAQFESKVIDELAQSNAKAAERIVLGLGYGHLGSAHNWHVRNTAASIGDSAIGPIKEALERIEKAEVSGHKPVEATANLVRVYTDWVMNSVNGTFEAGVKRAMAGRFMRDFLTGTEHAGKLTEEAVKAAAHELGSNPAAVEELLRFVQRKFGQYEHFSPEMRRWMINWTPFGAWMWNATTFLVRNLPQDHPGLVALLAANDSATRQWRRDNGIDATTADVKNGGQVPLFLQGSVPTPSWYARLMGVPTGTPLRLGRYTPFGLYSDPLSNIAQAFLPQFPLDALQGRSFTGAQLRNDDGTPYDSLQKATYAAKEGALATIPIIGQLTRFISYGGDVKAANRVLNPFAPTVPKQTGSGASSGGGLPSFGSSGSSSSKSSGGLPAFSP